MNRRSVRLGGPACKADRGGVGIRRDDLRPEGRVESDEAATHPDLEEALARLDLDRGEQERGILRRGVDVRVAVEDEPWIAVQGRR